MDRLAEVKRRAQRLQEAAKSLCDYVEASMAEIGEEERQRKRARSRSSPPPRSPKAKIAIAADPTPRHNLMESAARGVVDVLRRSFAEELDPETTQSSLLPPPQTFADPVASETNPALRKPERLNVSMTGGDCRDANWACTRPMFHRGKHNGRFVHGRVCSTIYPHNHQECHLWLGITVVAEDEVVKVEAHRIPEIFARVPTEHRAVLMAVHNFIFGDGSAMSRIWLDWCTTADRPTGPRSHIVQILNNAIAERSAAEALANLEVLSANAMNIPWPVESYIAEGAAKDINE